MKKTVTINISGIIFSIDEDAYKKLKIYLDTIKGYFKHSDGVDEIMTDIEARIAEMLQEKINEQKQVVNIDDVNQIISIMGQPEDYIDPDDQEEYTQTSFTEGSTKKRKTRKLYRDPDNQVIGGVCSGIGHYFGIDPVWARLALIIAFFTMGTGIILYIILWIIIPQAETTAEKLEMRGEPINVDNIGKAVEEEIGNVKKKFSEIRNSERTRRSEDHIRNGIQEFFSFLGKLLRLFFNVFGKVLGVVLIGVSIAMIIGLCLGMFTSMNTSLFFNSSSDIFELSSLLFIDEFDSVAAFTGVFLTTIIPLVAILIGGLAFFVSFKKSGRSIGLSLTGLWVLGVVLLFYSGITTASDFSIKSEKRNNVELISLTSDTLYLNAKDFEMGNRIEDRGFFLDIEDEYLYHNHLEVDVLKSKDDKYYVELIKTARGKEYRTAEQRADNILYEFSQDSTTLSLSKYLKYPIEDKWRNQKLKINVRIPLNKTIYLSQNVRGIIYDIKNVTDTYDDHMLGHYWKMTEDGLRSEYFSKEIDEIEIPEVDDESI